MLLAEDNHPRRLGPAKDALARLLNEKGVTDMFIALVHIDLFFQPSLFPMSREHGLVVDFEEEKQRIIDLLQATLGDSWKLLCPYCFRVTPLRDFPFLRLLCFVFCFP
jgi:hypothetical protein